MVFSYHVASAIVVATPQDRKPSNRNRIRAGTRAQPTPRTRYTRFRHESHHPPKVKLECSYCHAIPSPTAPDRVTAATKLTSLKGYPYHDSCLPCHRRTPPQFFRGLNPAICTVCHTRASPRLTATEIQPFPKQGAQSIAREFPGYFPHGLHQSVMAQHRPPPTNMNASLLLRRVSFGSTDVEKGTPNDICAFCHVRDERDAIELPLKGIPKEANFERVRADTFKTIPGDRDGNSHGYCFNCHWQAQKPTKDDCNGCHFLPSDYSARKLKSAQPAALSSKHIAWFKDWPAGLPKRLSLKFRHNTHTLSPDGKTESNNHDVGCTTCHVNINEMTTLSIPKADVQISACAQCHTKTAAIPVGQTNKVTIFDEVNLKSDTSKNYVCVACHLSVIGREPTPCTHYSVIGEPCPTSARSGEDYNVARRKSEIPINR